jgi:hypothetical protein
VSACKGLSGQILALFENRLPLDAKENQQSVLFNIEIDSLGKSLRCLAIVTPILHNSLLNSAAEFLKGIALHAADEPKLATVSHKHKKFPSELQKCLPAYILVLDQSM